MTKEMEDNKVIKKGGREIIVGSIDVDKLYPNMDMNMVVDEVRKEIIERGKV